MKNKSYIEREVVGYFQNMDGVNGVIDALSKIGIGKSEISLLTSAEDAEIKLGNHFAIKSIRTVDGVPEIIYENDKNDRGDKFTDTANLMYLGELAETAPVILSGGTLAAGLMAGLLGSAKSLKSAFEKLVGWEHAKHIEHELKKGGVLVWVRVWNDSDERRVSLILEKNYGKDVHVHRFENQPNPRGASAASVTKTLSYHGAPYIEAGPHEYYVDGKLFASEDEVKDYIRRHSYIEKIHADAHTAQLDLEKALQDPMEVFKSPAELMQADLTDDLKHELLSRWAFNIKELETAADDGMKTPDNPGPVLEEIERYLEELERSKRTK